MISRYDMLTEVPCTAAGCAGSCGQGFFCPVIPAGRLSFRFLTWAIGADVGTQEAFPVVAEFLKWFLLIMLFLPLGSRFFML